MYGNHTYKQYKTLIILIAVIFLGNSLLGLFFDVTEYWPLVRWTMFKRISIPWNETEHYELDIKWANGEEKTIKIYMLYFDDALPNRTSIRASHQLVNDIVQDEDSTLQAKAKEALYLLLIDTYETEPKMATIRKVTYYIEPNIAPFLFEDNSIPHETLVTVQFHE